MKMKLNGFGQKTGFVWLLTGPPGVGKSTIAKELAGRFKRTAWVDVDSLREMVVGGYAKPSSKTAEANRQIALSLENACAMAENFAEKGFNVFIDDIVVSKQKLAKYEKKLKKFQFGAFLLMADKKTVQKRDVKRSKKLVMGKRAIELHTAFSKIANQNNWTIIDTTKKTAKKTADEMLKTTPNLTPSPHYQGMNRSQFFGAILVIIGLLLLIVFPVFGIIGGKMLVGVSIFGGWIITLLGAAIVVVSLVFERLKDIKKEKEYKEY